VVILCVLVVSVIEIIFTPPVVETDNNDTYGNNAQLYRKAFTSDYSDPFRETEPEGLNYHHGCPVKMKGYASVVCPVWYDETQGDVVMGSLDPISKARGIDYRVRYLHKRQHTDDCHSKNFFTSGFTGSSMINSFYHTVGRGLWGSINSNRVSSR